MSTEDEPLSIQDKLTAAVDAIHAAKKINDSAQNEHTPGTSEWHMHESIDDKLYDALRHLGE